MVQLLQLAEAALTVQMILLVEPLISKIWLQYLEMDPSIVFNQRIVSAVQIIPVTEVYSAK